MRIRDFVEETDTDAYKATHLFPAVEFCARFSRTDVIYADTASFGESSLRCSKEFKLELERMANEPDSEYVEFDTVDDFLASLDSD